MKRSLSVLGSVALSVVVVACSGGAGGDDPGPLEPNLASQLEAEYGAPFTVDFAGSHAFVASPVARTRVVATNHVEAIAAAKALFSKHGRAFGAEHEAPSLAEADATATGTSVRFVQRVPGTEIEILGKGALLDLDDDGAMLDAIGALVDAPKLERPVTTVAKDVEVKVQELAASWNVSPPEMVGKPRLVATYTDGTLDITWHTRFAIDLQGFEASFDAYSLELRAVDAPRASLEGTPHTSFAKGLFGYPLAQVIDPLAKTAMLEVETTAKDGKYVLARSGSRTTSEVVTMECTGLSASDPNPKAEYISSETDTEFLGRYLTRGFNVNGAGLLGPGIAVDVHHNALEVDKQFRKLFDGESPSADGKLVGVIHMNDRFVPHTNGPPTFEKDAGLRNASWDPTTNLVGFGDGGYTEKQQVWVKPPGVALDIAGHEWAHAYITRKTRLTLVGEDGAMQEGIADAIGVLIAARAKETDFEGIGKTVRLDGKHLRNFRDPRQTKAPVPLAPDPDDGTKMTDMAQTPKYRKGMEKACAFAGPDQGCVHFNAGPLNHAFYLMVHGGDATDTIMSPAVGIRVVGGNLATIEKVWVNSARNAPNVAPVEPVRREVSFKKIEAMAIQQINFARSTGDVKTLAAVGCAWRGTGFVSREQLAARGITCPTDDTERASAPSECRGKPDGYYCSSASPFAATLCRGGAIAGGAQCPSGKVCAHKSATSSEARVTSDGAIACEAP